MREEEECEPGCYRHIYFLHICEEKIMLGECKRLEEDEVEEYQLASSWNHCRKKEGGVEVSPRDVRVSVWI